MYILVYRLQQIWFTDEHRDVIMNKVILRNRSPEYPAGFEPRTKRESFQNYEMDFPKEKYKINLMTLSRLYLDECWFLDDYIYTRSNK